MHFQSLFITYQKFESYFHSIVCHYSKGFSEYLDSIQQSKPNNLKKCMRHWDPISIFKMRMRVPIFRRITEQTIDRWMNGVWNVCFMFTILQFASGIHLSFWVEQIRKGFSGAWSILVCIVEQENLSKQRIALYQLTVWLKLKDKRKQRKLKQSLF